MPTASGWIIVPILLPLLGAPLAFAFGGRSARLIALAVAIGTPGSVVQIIAELRVHGAQRYPIGSWGAPLGIDLYVDGLSALMLSMSAIVGAAITIYACGYFRPREDRKQLAESAHSAGGGQAFWPLWMFTWAGLNALLLSADIFNIYVTLEVVSLSAVAMVALAGDGESFIAAFRYFLTSVIGSLAYLMGVALLYAQFGTLDMVSLQSQVTPGPSTYTALALMTAGLALKTALFPLHFWLPAAHASAPAPVSAILSSLVIKGSFYLLLRLWMPLFEPLGASVADLFGLLGAAAIIWGSSLALSQKRLKLLIAYSTVAQIGYLFLAFPLMTVDAGAALSGGVYHALSHAGAKAAMFMAAGAVIHSFGHDRIAELAGFGSRLPITTIAFGLAGMSLMGVPPSGGFASKWLLISVSLASARWWWAVVMLIGGLLAAAYVLKVLRFAFLPADSSVSAPAPKVMEITALLLAVLSLVMGLLAATPLELMRIGEPFATARIEAGP